MAIAWQMQGRSSRRRPSPRLPSPPLLPPAQLNQILTSLYISALTGLAYLAGWACLRGPFRRVLVKRNQLTDLFARPPPLRIQGFVFRCFGWLWPVFILSDGDFVQTAGLDALVRGEARVQGGLHPPACPALRRAALRVGSDHPALALHDCPLQIITRFLVLGIQLFTPISVVCCAVRESLWVRQHACMSVPRTRRLQLAPALLTPAGVPARACRSAAAVPDGHVCGGQHDGGVH